MLISHYLNYSNSVRIWNVNVRTWRLQHPTLSAFIRILRKSQKMRDVYYAECKSGSGRTRQKWHCYGSHTLVTINLVRKQITKFVTPGKIKAIIKKQNPRKAHYQTSTLYTNKLQPNSSFQRNKSNYSTMRQKNERFCLSEFFSTSRVRHSHELVWSYR